MESTTLAHVYTKLNIGSLASGIATGPTERHCASTVKCILGQLEVALEEKPGKGRGDLRPFEAADSVKKRLLLAIKEVARDRFTYLKEGGFGIPSSLNFTSNEPVITY
eukprot:GHVH01010771.1.p2 GENE.GHVH01010771.1~~GHVH01010771.1.p2  ORF type:complete len:108 (+),score=16.28 GHVH01010771.1:337-660(+)